MSDLRRDRDGDSRTTRGSDVEEHTILGGRLREAREYVGLLQEDVALALAIPRASVSALESGKRKVSGLELRRLARLYHRSVGWLLGDEDSELGDVEPLFRATAQLSPHDKEQVLRFAEFLAAAGRPRGVAAAAGAVQREAQPDEDRDD